MHNTSKSRLAVDREFMYIGSAGPSPGGRPGGRADGRMGGRADGRTDGRTDGRADFERQYNDVHGFSQTSFKNIVFVCRFASGRAARIDFYCKTEKCIKKTYKIDSVF